MFTSMADTTLRLELAHPGSWICNAFTG